MFFRSLIAISSLLLWTSALCAQVGLDSFLPVEGVNGTPLAIDLTGDTGKGKPKLWLTRSDDEAPKPKKTKLKVSEITDLGGGLTGLTASFKKTKTGPGLYDLHVKPRGKGLEEQVFKGVFTMRAPLIDSIGPNTAMPKEIVSIVGSFFGDAGKPKVSFVPEAGGKAKKAKVQMLTGGTLLMVKLPKLGDGLYDVVVKTKVGTGTLADGLSIETGPLPALDVLRMQLSSADQTLLLTDFEAGPDELGSTVMAFNLSTDQVDLCILTAGVLEGIETVGISLAFPFNPGVTQTPFTLPMGPSPPLFNIVMSQSFPDVNWGDGGSVPGSITVTSATATRVTGTFQFTLVPESPSPADGDVELMQGEFDITVQEG